MEMPACLRASGEIDPSLKKRGYVYNKRSTPNRVEVELLPDSGAQMNLIDDRIVSSLNLITRKLDRPLRIGSIKDKDAVTSTKQVTCRHSIGRSQFVDTFFVARLAKPNEILLGTPWLRKHQPEVMKLLETLGENSETFGGGGNLEPETLADRRETILRLRAAVCEALEEYPEEDYAPEIDDHGEDSGYETEEVSSRAARRRKSRERARALRSQVQGDPGIRGLTGNPEGWEKTIPPELADFTHTVFSEKGLREKPPPRPGFECVITLKEGEVLTKRKPYELTPQQLRNLKALMDNELASGVVSRSRAPHAAPGFWVTDPGSKQERWVVDYQELNQKTVRNVYPLPRINTIMDKAGTAFEVTLLDISGAFGRIPMAEKSKELTAFTTPIGMFQYNVMPMGLANAPSEWQRFMDSILGPLLHDFCEVYLDDIIIISKNHKEHVDHVRQVLKILEEHKLYVKPHKARFFKKEVDFLGFRIVCGKGVRMADDKLQAIRDLQPPKRIRDLRGLLGVMGFYMGFIPHFADTAAPLTELLKKDEPWVWNDRRQRAFEELKRRFTKDVFLASADPEKPYRVSTDASDVAFAAIIEQQDDQGRWRPVLMCSHKFKDGEKGWSSGDKELYAIVYVFSRYRKWLSQPKFPVLVRSDCRNLGMFMFTTDLLRSHDGRLARWWETLSQCNFTIEHIPGKDNLGPDVLSRYNHEDSVDLPRRQLLPAYRFTEKSLTEIDKWFRTSKDPLGLRRRLEASFAARPREENQAWFKVNGDFEKLNDSAPGLGSARMAAPQRAVFEERYRRAFPDAKVPDPVTRRPGNHGGVGI